MRWLAVLLMLQGHVLDSWVRPEDRSSEWFWLSQFLGGFPAPIFLFLAGVSLALVLDRMRAKGAAPADLAAKVCDGEAGSFSSRMHFVWSNLSCGIPLRIGVMCSRSTR
jgi:uncharacterized membrane protein